MKGCVKFEAQRRQSPRRWFQRGDRSDRRGSV